MAKSVGNKLSTVLTALGARLKRERKHYVYELPNGKTFVTAKSPSDHRAEQNAIADVKRVAGVERKPHESGERRDRRVKPGRAGAAPRTPAPVNTGLASALRQTGLVEQQLRARITELEEEITATKIHTASLQAELDRLWWTRFRRWLSTLGKVRKG